MAKEKLYRRLWYVSVFAFVFFWFTQIHPLVLFDADDWNYASYFRWALPQWGDWNPARVFPETFMPLVCGISARVLYPLTGDYLRSIMVGSAFVMAACIVGYVYSFEQLIHRLFRLAVRPALVVSSVFFLFHFLVFHSQQASNQYMFYCWDFTCYYFYLIPSLLNASLVMWMSHNTQFDRFCREGDSLLKGFFLLAVYLAIFSNLPSSGILAAFAGCRVLLAFIEQFRKRSGVKCFVQQNFAYIGILTAWLASAIFELSGGRAGDANQNVLDGLLEVVKYLSHPTVYCGKLFMVTAFLLLAAMAGILLMRKKKEAEDVRMLSFTLEIFVCGLALLVYMLLLIAKVSPAFVSRSEYLFGLFFYVIVIVSAAFAYIVKRYPGTLVAVPFALCVIISSMNTPWLTYKESNMGNTDAAICKRIGDDLVEQMIQADQNGATSVNLHVPVTDNPDNWPHFAGKYGIAIANSLFEHGIIGREIEVTIIPDEAMNEKYSVSHNYG